MAKQAPDGRKPIHRRRRRKPTPPPDTIIEPEATADKPPEAVTAPEPPMFVYTYTVWTRFPSSRDN